MDWRKQITQHHIEENILKELINLVARQDSNESVENLVQLGGRKSPEIIHNPKQVCFEWNASEKERKANEK